MGFCIGASHFARGVTLRMRWILDKEDIKYITSKAVCHFSCGSTSAIATKLALEKFGPENVEIIYADPGAEHPDNQRFLKECEEKLFKKKVTIVKSKKYKTIFDVFEDKKVLNFVTGAPCTTEMKKIPIRDYLGARLYDEVQVFGYDPKDAGKGRVDKFRMNNPDLTTWFPLVEENISKGECLTWLEGLGIPIPQMYRLGFSNANCVGCVKAENISYWQSIRKNFPDTFKWFADFERTIGKKEEGNPKGAAINKRYIKGVRHRVFLDELPQEPEPEGDQLDFFCGYTCG